MARQGTKKVTEREQKQNKKMTKRKVPPHCILGTTYWKKSMVMEHEEISRSETGTEKYQNVTETENGKMTSARPKAPWRYHTDIKLVWTVLIPRNHAWLVWPARKLRARRLPMSTWEKMSHCLWLGNQFVKTMTRSSKGADIEEEDESERDSKRFSVRVKDGEVRRPPLLTSLNDTKHRYGLNQLLGIGVLLSGR
jgi:hypothetical protein